jgi:hypothetical protein
MIPQSNIINEHAISLASTDYEDKQGFFFRAATGGTIKYDPVGNDDGDYIEFTADSSQYFNDCRVAKKIYRVGTTATGLYAGKGV